MSGAPGRRRSAGGTWLPLAADVRWATVHPDGEAGRGRAGYGRLRDRPPARPHRLAGHRRDPRGGRDRPGRGRPGPRGLEGRQRAADRGVSRAAPLAAAGAGADALRGRRGGEHHRRADLRHRPAGADRAVALPARRALLARRVRAAPPRDPGARRRGADRAGAEHRQPDRRDGPGRRLARVPLLRDRGRHRPGDAPLPRADRRAARAHRRARARARGARPARRARGARPRRTRAARRDRALRQRDRRAGGRRAAWAARG